MINVVVMGALGRMGREVCRAVLADPGLSLSGAVDPGTSKSDTPEGTEFKIVAEKELIDQASADVMVDFTKAQAAVENINWALDNGINVVAGTTGISEADLEKISERTMGGAANVIIASNFALGAVLMMRFSELAAGVFDQCEIIEKHHRGKLDAPSGTAIETAVRVGRVIETAKPPVSKEGRVPGSRGGELGGVNIHSVRLDGLVAHQEVIFGSTGETLSIRHDTTDRSCFMPGVILAINSVGRLPGLTIGLDRALEI